MKEFALALSIWTHTGTEWVLESHDVLKEPSHQEHCEFSSYEEMKREGSENRYFKVIVQCYPVSCSEKEIC